ncbi:uncharacterized protein LOC119711185 [Motacilla alba alba]|uniref:uncharacterized protein LOC119711185 n=1 Tax=Motacilla alba alba TaxID=1094192 RepID=UPI0018D4FE09|nr:uncharacterized protein LOC119711185 [Motacilla alba alba]
MQTRPKLNQPHATGAVNPCQRGDRPLQHRVAPRGDTGCWERGERGPCPPRCLPRLAAICSGCVQGQEELQRNEVRAGMAAPGRGCARPPAPCHPRDTRVAPRQRGWHFGMSLHRSRRSLLASRVGFARPRRAHILLPAAPCHPPPCAAMHRDSNPASPPYRGSRSSPNRGSRSPPNRGSWSSPNQGSRSPPNLGSQGSAPPSLPGGAPVPTRAPPVPAAVPTRAPPVPAAVHVRAPAAAACISCIFKEKKDDRKVGRGVWLHGGYLPKLNGCRDTGKGSPALPPLGTPAWSWDWEQTPCAH